jgi:hypothetical protein
MYSPQHPSAKVDKKQHRIGHVSKDQYWSPQFNSGQQKSDQVSTCEHWSTKVNKGSTKISISKHRSKQV